MPEDFIGLSPDFEAAFMASPHLYLILTPDLKIAAANDVYCQITKRQRSHVLGRYLFDVLPADDSRAEGFKKLRTLLMEVVQSRQPAAMPVHRFDIPNPESEGGFETRFWVLSSRPILTDGGEVAWILYSADDVTESVLLKEEGEARLERVHDQQQTIAELRNTSQFLDALIEDLPGILFVKSYPDFRFLAVNRAWEESRGRTRAEVLGKTDFDFYPKEEVDEFLIRDRATLETGLPQVTQDEKVTTAINGVRYFKTTKVPVKDENGKPLYLLGFSEDVTERKQMELQLRQAVKMEAVGQLTGGIAHDFNNLLGVVIGNLDVLMDDQALKAEMRDCIQEALDGALRGAELTRRLLAFSRNKPSQTKIVDLNAGLTNLTAMLRRTLGGNTLVELRLATGLWKTRADPAQLDEAILNMAINARDAMPNGGTLTIETANTHVAPGFSTWSVPTGDYVQLTISDTGSGMPPDVVERCFDPFFTTKSAEKGTGLGLSMVYGLVKQSGGSVEIDSEIGEGTRIVIYLPRTRGDVPASITKEQASALPKTGNELILVVEDNPSLRRLTMKQVREIGYRAVEADSATAALKLLETHSGIALLFTDIMMPGGMTGVELAERARQEWPSLKVLLTSGFAGQGTSNNLVHGIDLDLINKPFRRDELARRIRSTLDR